MNKFSFNRSTHPQTLKSVMIKLKKVHQNPLNRYLVLAIWVFYHSLWVLISKEQISIY